MDRPPGHKKRSPFSWRDVTDSGGSTVSFSFQIATLGRHAPLILQPQDTIHPLPP